MPAEVRSLIPNELQERYRELGYWQNVGLIDIIIEQATATPDAPVYLEPARITYRELATASRQLATFLAGHGVGVGDAVVAPMVHTWQAAAVSGACSLLGAMLAPLPSRSGPDQVRALVTALDAKAVFLSARILEREVWSDAFPGLYPDLPEATVVSDEFPVPECVPAEVTRFSLAIDGLVEHETQVIDRLAPALLLSTGGTTGPSKVVVHCENAIVYAAREYASQCRLTSRDTMLIPGPYGHASGSIFGLYAPMLAGAQIAPLQAWSAEACGDVIAKHGVTWGMFSGTHIYDLLGRYPGPTADLATIRGISAGSGADAQYAEAERRFGFLVRRMYGLTECLGHALMPEDVDPELRVSRDGLPFAATTPRIVAPGSSEGLEAGSTGEYIVRGPSLFMGYFGRPDLTENAMTPDGYLRTGDIMNIDEHGFVKYVGRLKDVIRRGGINIDPMPIERVLIEDPGIADASVVGMPDERLGEVVAAVIVPSNAAVTPDLDAIKHLLLGKGVPKTSLPQVLFVWDDLPKTEVGKHNKIEMRKRISPTFDADTSAGPSQ